MKDFDDFMSDLYFEELETRERIFGRLQLNFAIYTSILAIMGYMARMFDESTACLLKNLFWDSLIVSAILLAGSIYFTIKALGGYEYKLFSNTEETLRYRKELEDYLKTPKGKADKDVESFNDGFMSSIAECVEHNSGINELRRQRNRMAMNYLTYCLAPLLLSGFFFVYFDMDVSSPRKAVNVDDKNINQSIQGLNQTIYTIEQDISNGKAGKTGAQPNASGAGSKPPTSEGQTP